MFRRIRAARARKPALDLTADDRRELADMAAPGWSLDGHLLADYPGWKLAGMTDPGAARLAR